MYWRVTGYVADLRARHANDTIALVTHGGVIRILLAEALGMPHVNIFRVAQGYAAINRIRYYDATPSVELVNYSPSNDTLTVCSNKSFSQS
jgi:broad specificity phosphatase PhoE